MEISQESGRTYWLSLTVFNHTSFVVTNEQLSYDDVRDDVTQRTNSLMLTTKMVIKDHW